MYMLSSVPYNLKAKSILHLVHPKMLKDPMTQHAIQFFKSTTSSICEVGVHILTKSRFESFDVVILHDCNEKFLLDFNKRLLNTNYLEYIKSMMHWVSDKTVIFLGNTNKILSEKVTIIPKTGNVLLNDITSTVNVDVNTKGLNLLKFRVDINYDFNIHKKDTPYERALLYLSKSDSIIILDSRACYCSRSKTSREAIKFGSIYLCKNEKIVKIAGIPTDLTEAQEERLQQRTIKPITPIYKDESEYEDKLDKSLDGQLPGTDTANKK